MNKIPILLYHDIYTKEKGAVDNFAVSVENFRQQMEYLHKNGFTVLSLDKVMNSMRKDEIIDSRKKVILTFDDGDLSNYEIVLPILKEKGFTATFFITIKEIGKPNRMAWQMIYELSKEGMDVGSHGMYHNFMTHLKNYVILNDLLNSKQILEKYTRKRVNFLSIPRGFYNKRILNISRDLAFKAVCISDAGYNDFLDEDLFLLKRFTMRKKYNLKTFISICCGRPSLKVSGCESIRTCLRKLLGYQVYDKLKRFKSSAVRRQSTDKT